jgi:hypothetical protein
VDSIDALLAEDPIDLRAEATAAAEAQLAFDRVAVKRDLALLGEAITDRNKKWVCRFLAEITWLEHRITQTELMNTALWCRECAKEGNGPAELPGMYWMCFECLGHAEEQLQRSAKSWERSLFA